MGYFLKVEQFEINYVETAFWTGGTICYSEFIWFPNQKIDFNIISKHSSEFLSKNLGPSDVEWISQLWKTCPFHFKSIAGLRVILLSQYGKVLDGCLFWKSKRRTYCNFFSGPHSLIVPGELLLGVAALSVPSLLFFFNLHHA